MGYLQTRAVPSFLALRRAALAIVVFFSLIAIAQYVYVRAESVSIVDRQMREDAEDLNRGLGYDHGLDPSTVNKADIPGRSIVVLSDGELASLDTGSRSQSAFPPSLLPPVSLPPSTEGIFARPTAFINNSPDLTQTESWILAGKRLDRGYVVVGLSQFDKADPRPESRASMLAENLEHFAGTLENAQRVQLGDLDNEISWIVVNGQGQIVAGMGRIPLKTNAIEVGRLSQQSGLVDFNGAPYYVLHRPITDKQGNVVGSAILFDDTKHLATFLSNLVKIDSAVAAVSALVLLFATFMTQRKHEAEKRAIREAFQHYFSPKVLEAILREPAKLTLGGQRREVTILFSDIRSFTALTEKLPPQELTRLLQEYFDEMAEAVYATDGTLDKYIGDAVMAFWGAPIEQPDQANRAVTTALDMAQRLEKLREKWAAEGLPVLDIGIGINLGIATVGNFGSTKRYDYTVIGDAVNAASRIESLTKDFQNHIIISESTRSQLTIPVETKDLGEVRVRGKDTPIRVFEVAAQ
jgi:class 3 adenylate cyclase